MADTPGSADQAPVDPYEEIEKRKRWFFECTLRGFNMDSFRNVNEKFPDPALRLTTDPVITAGIVAGQVGLRMKSLGLAYLDNEHPVWTIEEKQQRDAFQDSTIGEVSDWLSFTNPKTLAARIAALREIYERSRYSSTLDGSEALNAFPRKNLFGDNLPHAMARIELCLEKPWLIPDLYQMPKPILISAREWIENAEFFIGSVESEWLEISGMASDTDRKFDPKDTSGYKAFFMQAVEEGMRIAEGTGTQESKKNISDFVQVTFRSTVNGKDVLDIKIGSPTFPLDSIGKHPVASVGYWSRTYDLKEIFLNAANSDMGLCLLMRSLYLYGNLPSTFDKDRVLAWRTRKTPDVPKLSAFINDLSQDHELKVDNTLADRLNVVALKLTALLEINAADPFMANILYSPLNAEVYKQALLRYKFWIDEPFHAFDNDGDPAMVVENFWDVMYSALGGGDTDPKGINKTRVDMGKEKEAYAEMEYWSENHYIMFASSEYLAGQLWEKETFQPAKDFLSEGSELGKKDGLKRRRRGKSRVLKWLNNKLMFGWTEFNSSGYYREHLYALLNLVDFALDDEVKKKATVVTDLLFFDLVRFLHKSSMGACGGRSQFHSKNSGWDNALGDVIELLFGERGIFGDNGGEIGSHFATSTYTIPAVLLEIGLFPPESSIDRSRVSISFDEAPKYGFTYSYETDQRFSLQKAYQSKLERHSSALKNVNDAIALNHDDGYGQKEEDTMFWWSQSAFYNKETILNTFDCIKKFKLFSSPAFKESLRNILDVYLPLVHRAGLGVAGSILAGLPGAVVGYFSPDVLSIELDETAADELSFFLEGSTRSRTNIYTYRNRDVMLSSIQNFRPGQLNFQSNVNQATISAETNVFTTSAFPGFRLSAEFAAAKGSLIGSAAGLLGGPAMAVGGALVGGVISLVSNETDISYDNSIGDNNDGPGWWTGYWSLPLIVQHENTSIIAYDFNFLQKNVTDAGSHAWFPKKGFDQVNQQRTSAYDDSNFPLFEISGKRGYWLFGQKIHKKDASDPELNDEAYIGIFSNREPEWQDKDSDFHKWWIDEKNKKALSDIRGKIGEILDEIEKQSNKENNVGGISKQIIRDLVKATVNNNKDKYLDKERWSKQTLDAIGGFINFTDRKKELIDLYIDEANHLRIWANPIPEDFFADKDWYAESKNIWIIQVGNKKEYGSYENFKNKVSSAKVELDDLGDLECTYHIPKADGSTQKLSLIYDDRKFSLDGNDIDTDFYPRFENLFVRGGLVEWGQREYVIEYHNKRLLHSFTDLLTVERTEDVSFKIEDLEIVKGLVIYIKTEGEDMDMDSIAQASVTIGCETVATDEVVAAGEVEENTAHDAEWIYFDKSGQISADMTIVIKHPPIDGDDDPEWEMSFSLKALMGNHRLYDCSVAFPKSSFKDSRRSTNTIPFSINLSRWQTWKPAIEKFDFVHWQIAGMQSRDFYYYDHVNFFTVDSTGRLLHARFGTCDGPETVLEDVDVNGSLRFTKPFSIASFCFYTDDVFVFAIHASELFACWQLKEENFENKQWSKLQVQARLGADPSVIVPVPLMPESQVVVRSTTVHNLQLFVSAADNHFYSTSEWYPTKQAFPVWRQISSNAEFSPLRGAAFEVADDFLFALDVNRRLWVGEIDTLFFDSDITPNWKLVSGQKIISNFTVARKDKFFMIIITTTNGEIWATKFSGVENEGIWDRVGGTFNFVSSPECTPAWSVPGSESLDIFVIGIDGKVYTNFWSEQKGWESGHNWIVVNDFDLHFENKLDKKIVALNRVINQTELYTLSDAHTLWKTWWS